eukprot:GHVU01074541.1.p1 GENE.GHVU01074541.1~~GHVU01074541.1.p1  ORF type:complete len:106 (-),score=0.98 GHVU01074541.1:234-551(-)
MCVYMCLCLCSCLCVCVCFCLCVYLPACLCVCVSVYLSASVCMCVCVCLNLVISPEPDYAASSFLAQQRGEGRTGRRQTRMAEADEIESEADARCVVSGLPSLFK